MNSLPIGTLVDAVLPSVELPNMAKDEAASSTQVQTEVPTVEAKTDNNKPSLMDLAATQKKPVTNQPTVATQTTTVAQPKPVTAPVVTPAVKPQAPQDKKVKLGGKDADKKVQLTSPHLQVEYKVQSEGKPSRKGH